MKIFHSILAAAALAAPFPALAALDANALAAVAEKFNDGSPDNQYKARVELNQLVDQATAPEGGDRAAATKTLCAALGSAKVSAEAKKYILRALTRVGTADAIDTLTELLAGPDAVLGEEARLTLESIHDPKAAAILGQALKAAGDKRAKIALANSLAQQKSATSIPALAQLVVDSDPAIARAGVTAIARIGGSAGLATLAKAYGSDKVAAETKIQIEKALLYAGLTDVALAQKIFTSTTSAPVRMAAFAALTKGSLSPAATAAIEASVKSDNTILRQAALRRGLELSLPSLQKGLAQSMDQLPKGDRLVVLSSIHLVKPAADAEAIALAATTAEDEDERVAAISALGRIDTKPAFAAVLQALGAREPAINQAAARALAQMTYADADAILVGMLKGSSSDDKVLAVKAVAHRQVPDSNTLLLEIIKGDDSAARGEAIKTIFFTASIDDLGTLCAAAKAANDADLKRTLSSVCKKIASRIDTDAARKLVEGL